jgi:hypothetical protein
VACVFPSFDRTERRLLRRGGTAEASRDASVGCDDVVAEGQEDGLELGGHVELGEDVGDVVALGCGGDVETVGDRRADEPLGERLEDLVFAR